jgi:threonine dehydratase
MIFRARLRLAGLLHRTPLVHSATLSDRLGARVYLKLECLQRTGSFKPRGAFNKLLSESAEARERGVAAVSGGNHAQAVAYASQQLGIPAVIFMPRTSARNSIEATRGYGAEVVLTPDIQTAFAEAERRRDRLLIHPFDDPVVAAGQGTIGLEILEDLPGATWIYSSIGGGGLISGLATAVRGLKPDVHVVGVQTHGADAMARSLEQDRLVELPEITSIARTLGAPRVSPFTFDHVRRLVDEVCVVDDAAAVDAMTLLLERTKQLVEPAGSCCLAAAERHRDRFAPDDRVVLLLCGGNVSVDDLAAFRRRFADAAPRAEEGESGRAQWS